MHTGSAPLLDVQHQTVVFEGSRSKVTAVDDVSFQMAAGETLGLVGESGSGKSVTAFTILRLVQPPGRVTAGRVLFEGRDLLALPERDMRQVRGARISLIFQEPMTALNPVMRVGDQIAEALTVHGLASGSDARGHAVDLLAAVRIPDAAQRVRDYPHQLSGGMRQRVMIAIALACRPPLVIADEPTTALDVTIQAQVLELLRELKAQYNLAVLLITHDFGVVNEVADRVAVMYAGQIVEEGTRAELLGHPRHPYTQGLLKSIPRPEARGTRLNEIKGVVPRPGKWPAGCRFHTRCPLVFDRCRSEEPARTSVSATQAVWCHLAEQEMRP
jgi:oligopeptide/dipeptide ABC transporter ATP-binding protein